MPIKGEFLTELKMKNDIEDLISSYVTLRRRGKNLVGLCPFHNEKTPSFTVFPESQSYHCFGCGAGGDAITFVRTIENLDYGEAVKFLAQRIGMNMPEDGYDDTLSKQRRRILEANREAAHFFHEYLISAEGAEAMEYFVTRGITQSTIRKFGLGYAPNSWDALIKHMQVKKFTIEDLFIANLVQRSQRTQRYYDNFRNRAMIPIIDLRGNVVGFGGRVLDDSKPKYINTSDTLVYKKLENVFALNFAKSNAENGLILAEGYMDVISLHQAGFKNAVASLGTALTQEQARIISRYANEVVLAYDSDEAGQNAARKAINIFSSIGTKVKVLKLVGGKDPDEIIKNHGKERFKRLIENAENDIEYRFDKERAKYDITTADGKIDFLKAACAILSNMEPIKIDIYSNKLAEELSVDKNAILQQIKRTKTKLDREKSKEYFNKIQRNAIGKGDKINPQRSEYIRCAKAEEGLIAMLIFNPDFYKHVKEKLSTEDFVTDFNRRVFSVLEKTLEVKGNVTLSDFSADFSTTEMGKLSEYEILGRKSSNTIKECDDYISVILEERDKIVLRHPENISIDEMSKTFEKLAMIKKNKGSKYE